MHCSCITHHAGCLDISWMNPISNSLGFYVPDIYLYSSGCTGHCRGQVIQTLGSEDDFSIHGAVSSLKWQPSSPFFLPLTRGGSVSVHRQTVTCAKGFLLRWQKSNESLRGTRTLRTVDIFAGIKSKRIFLSSKRGWEWINRLVGRSSFTFIITLFWIHIQSCPPKAAYIDCRLFIKVMGCPPPRVWIIMILIFLSWPIRDVASTNYLPPFGQIALFVIM